MVDSPLLTSADVAQLFGVTSTTVKRWADAGLLSCEKTLGKHRRFSPSEVDRFKRSFDANLTASGPSAPSEPWIDDFLRTLRDASSQSAVEARLLDMHARLGGWSLVADHLAVALCEIGDRWSRGELSILDEHVMSERLGRALARFADGLPRATQAPRVFLAVPDGDEHTLGLSLTELCFRENAWDTLWFGHRTPLSALPEEIAHHAPKLGAVALSASVVSADAARLSRDVVAIERACEAHNALLFLGGRGAWPEHPAYGHRLDSFAGLAQEIQRRSHS